MNRRKAPLERKNRPAAGRHRSWRPTAVVNAALDTWQTAEPHHTLNSHVGPRPPDFTQVFSLTVEQRALFV